MYSTKGFDVAENIPLSAAHPMHGGDDVWTARQSVDSFHTRPHQPPAAHYPSHPAEYGRGYDEEHAGYSEPEMKRELRAGYNATARDEEFVAPVPYQGHDGYGQEDTSRGHNSHGR